MERNKSILRAVAQRASFKDAPVVTTEPRGMEQPGERFLAELPDGTVVEAVVGYVSGKYGTDQSQH